MAALTAESLARLASAACRDYDPSLFFGPDGEDFSRRETRERRAKLICAGCIIRSSCAELALSLPPSATGDGIWGGMSEDDRRRQRGNLLARARRAAA